MGMQTKRLFGILAVVVGMAFWAGCSDNGNGDKGGNGGGDFSGLTELRLSGQVWATDLVKYTGSRVVYGRPDGIGGSGNINNGQLNFTIGTPNTSQLISILEWLEGAEDEYDNIVVSNDEAMMADLWLSVGGNIHAVEFLRAHDVETANGGTVQFELYIYVDRNVNITGKGKTFDGYDYGIATITTNDFTLNLKKGWNIINQKEERVGDIASTITVSLGEVSNGRWWLSYFTTD